MKEIRSKTPASVAGVEVTPDNWREVIAWLESMGWSLLKCDYETSYSSHVVVCMKRRDEQLWFSSGQVVVMVGALFHSLMRHDFDLSYEFV